MTATNHALTGATIGLLVGDAFVAVPAAFLSHFVCDIIPHFGSAGSDKKWIKSATFKKVLLADAALCVVLVGALYGFRPHHWQLACICAFTATSPDLVWLNRFIRAHLNKPWKPSLFSRFAGVIQWFQKPIGAVVEVAYAAGAIIVLASVIR